MRQTKFRAFHSSLLATHEVFQVQSHPETIRGPSFFRTGSKSSLERFCFNTYFLSNLTGQKLDRKKLLASFHGWFFFRLVSDWKHASRWHLPKYEEILRRDLKFCIGPSAPSRELPKKERRVPFSLLISSSFSLQNRSDLMLGLPTHPNSRVLG